MKKDMVLKSLNEKVSHNKADKTLVKIFLFYFKYII
jgi:hypothetical protein